MAVTSVGLGPSFLAWSQVGLTHLLLDVPVDSLSSGFFQGQAQAVANTEQNAAVSGKPAVLSDQSPTPSDPLSGQSEPQPDSSASIMASAPSFCTVSDAMKNSALWPEPWAGWFQKVTPAPILWTYHELGADLTGAGRSPERSAFFRDVIGELRLPKGSSVFWPSAMPLPYGNDLQANPEVFAAGLSFLSPQIVAVFGQTAMDDIGLNACGNYFSQCMVEGKLVVVLPEIHDLLLGVAQRNSTVSLLRAVFMSVRFG